MTEPTTGAFTDSSERWMALFDMGLFWGWFKAGRGKPDPEPTANIIKGFTSWVRNRALEHSRTILFTDAPTLYKQTIPGAENYKRREHDPDGLTALAEATRILRDEHKLLVWASEGLEADDGIAAYAQAASGSGWHVRIFADDKDLLSLLTIPNVTVFRRPPGSDKMNRRDCTAEDVAAHFGVPTLRLPEYLAFVDKVDGIEGIKGIGDVGALALLKAYCPVTVAFDDVDESGLPAAKVEARVRKALVGKRSALELALRLARFEPDAFERITEEWLAFPSSTAAPFAGPSQGSTFTTEEREQVSDNGTVTKVLEQVETQSERSSLIDDVTYATEQKIAAGDWLKTFDRSLEPRSIEGAWDLARTLSEAMIWSPREKRLMPMYGKIGNVNAIFAIILKGRELGLPAMLSLAHIKIVEGKAECDAALMVALALRSGRVKHVRCTLTTDERAVWEVLHASSGSKPVTLEWDLDRATRAGLYPAKDAYSPWGKYTRVMLRWRAVSELLRMACPEAIAGLYVRGEVDDMISDEEFERARSAENRIPT